MTTSAPETSVPSVPKKVEEALLFRLKARALEECQEYAKAYADCCRGRLVSVAWVCRAEALAMSDCTHRYTCKLDLVKRRWQAAGSPSSPDWESLLSNLA